MKANHRDGGDGGLFDFRRETICMLRMLWEDHQGMSLIPLTCAEILTRVFSFTSTTIYYIITVPWKCALLSKGGSKRCPNELRINWTNTGAQNLVCKCKPQSNHLEDAGTTCSVNTSQTETKPCINHTIRFCVQQPRVNAGSQVATFSASFPKTKPRISFELGRLQWMYCFAPRNWSGWTSCIFKCQRNQTIFRRAKGSVFGQGAEAFPLCSTMVSVSISESIWIIWINEHVCRNM